MTGYQIDYYHRVHLGFDSRKRVCCCFARMDLYATAPGKRRAWVAVARRYRLVNSQMTTSVSME